MNAMTRYLMECCGCGPDPMNRDQPAVSGTHRFKVVQGFRGTVLDVSDEQTARTEFASRAAAEANFGAVELYKDDQLIDIAVRDGGIKSEFKDGDLGTLMAATTM